jgi:hypothetical protein
MLDEKFEVTEEILEDENIEIEEVGKNKERAEKRRLDRVKKARKANIAALKTTDEKTQCPKEKRLKKKVAGRKARYSKDEHSFGAYKKCCSMD